MFKTTKNCMSVLYLTRFFSIFVCLCFYMIVCLILFIFVIFLLFTFTFCFFWPHLRIFLFICQSVFLLSLFLFIFLLVVIVIDSFLQLVLNLDCLVFFFVFPNHPFPNLFLGHAVFDFCSILLYIVSNFFS